MRGAAGAGSAAIGAWRVVQWHAIWDGPAGQPEHAMCAGPSLPQGIAPCMGQAMAGRGTEPATPARSSKIKTRRNMLA